MSRAESGAGVRQRIADALDMIGPACTPHDQAVLAAERIPNGSEKQAAGLPVAVPRVFPASVAVVIEDPAAFLDWAEQVGAVGTQHPLAGARLDPATARAYASAPPPGCRAYYRTTALMVPVPAGYAIANRKDQR